MEQERNTPRARKEKYGKNLGFFRKWLESQGISIAEATEKTRFSKNVIYEWFNRDNTTLENLHAVYSAFGYRLYLRLEPKSTVIKEGDVWLHVNASINLATGAIRPDEEMRTDFIRKAISASGLTQAKVAESIGMSRNMISYYFKNDDFQMEDVVKIKEFLKLELHSYVIAL